MKKTLLSVFSLVAVCCATLLTSCLGEGTNKATGYGYFTISKEATGYTLYQDHGGVVRCSLSELNNVASGTRGYLLYTYTDDNIKEEAGKGYYIDNAEINDGYFFNEISSFTRKADAEAKNMLDTDSVAAIRPLDANSGDFVSIYRGYLTIQCRAYCGTSVAPSFNIIYDPEENTSSSALKLNLCYNPHVASDKLTGIGQVIKTFALSSLGVTPLTDENITVVVDGLGMSEPLSVKITHDDLTPGNYIYFQK